MTSFGVLGPLEVHTADGVVVALAGERQRRLLALLLANHGRVVSAAALVEAVFADRAPANPAAALHNQISRLRRALGDSVLDTTPHGYRVLCVGLDADQFESLVGQARNEPARAVELLTEALSLWRGRAYGEFTEIDDVTAEAARLEELRCTAIEERAEALVAAGRGAEAVADLESFVAAHRLRERAHAALMRALYASGRHADALDHYAQYSRHLADELGLEPSVMLQRLEIEILRHSLVAPTTRNPAPLDQMAIRYVRRHDGHPLAVATVGDGPTVMSVPPLVTSLDLIAAGRDPRASLLENLARHVRLTHYDRLGTGLSRGVSVPDHGLEAATDELESMLEQVTGPATLLGASQAGPVAVNMAARRPDLVEKLVLLGTYANGPVTFPADFGTAAVALVRSHPRVGATMMAGLFRPTASDDACQRLATMLLDAADPDTCADYLAAVYTTDVSSLLPQIDIPALVLHYRDDRMIPFHGGQQLATGLPHARFVAIDGPFHMPDARDLGAITRIITEFIEHNPGA
jgi:DNA-binding SARP family transcriptional activator/pimeloyl-ACP methyl ester carboxylesterase